MREEQAGPGPVRGRVDGTLCERLGLVRGPVESSFGSQPLADQLRAIAVVWSHSQHRLVVLAVEFADSNQWVLEAATPAQWLALVADVVAGTARQWIRIGRRLRDLPLIAAAFAAGDLSDAKVRALTRLATPNHQAELLEIATLVPAAELRPALARWLTDTCDPDQLDAHHHTHRHAAATDSFG